MSYSIYDASIPMLTKTLQALSTVLDKAAQHAEKHKIEQSVFLTTRLFPDMFDFTRQIQICTDFAKGTGARLAGVEIPKYEDGEKSFGELKIRIERTIAFLGSLDRAAIEAGADRHITLQIRGETLHTTGRQFLAHRAIPNFYFHATTAYNLLRHNGVDLGKADFIGKL